MTENENKSVLTELLRKVEDNPEKAPATNETDMASVCAEGDEVVELGENFDLGEFQVVRREFFAHQCEPSVSFNNCKFTVNTACITKFPDTNYVQVLINQKTKVLALRPCSEGARDSYLWCNISKGKRKPKSITCKLFFAKVVSMMEWNPKFRYKLLGKLIHANGEYLIAFDMTATEVYQRTFPEGEKPKTSRSPVFPAGWQNQFGLPYNEHKQSMQINIFDGYAIYAIKDSETANGDSNSADISSVSSSGSQTDGLPSQKYYNGGAIK